jgi:hypothetical protein
MIGVSAPKNGVDAAISMVIKGVTRGVLMLFMAGEQAASIKAFKMSISFMLLLLMLLMGVGATLGVVGVMSGVMSGVLKELKAGLAAVVTNGVATEGTSSVVALLLKEPWEAKKTVQSNMSSMLVMFAVATVVVEEVGVESRGVPVRDTESEIRDAGVPKAKDGTGESATLPFPCVSKSNKASSDKAFSKLGTVEVEVG